MKMKRFLAGMALTGAAAMALCACGETGSAGTPQGGSSALSAAEDVYGLGAVTTVKLLGSSFAVQAVEGLGMVQTLSAKTETPEIPVGAPATPPADAPADPPADAPAEDAAPAENPDAAKEQIENFNRYFNMLDSLLGEDVISTVVSENSDEGYTDYAVKLSITGKDIDGNDVTHLLYYNETLVKEKVKEDETETKYELNGVMVLDGVDYVMRGEREVETEEDESEEEIRLRAYPDENDLSTYVQVRQENSAEIGEAEKKYVYSIYRESALVEETSVEFETEREGDKQSEEYKLEFLSGEGRGKYKVERDTTEEGMCMKVLYDVGGQKGSFRVRRTEDGAYEYTFSDQSKVSCRKVKDKD